MGNDDDFICAVILPLAGSTTDELTEEENEQLPIDLQYLPSDKKRESDRDIQQILLETILLVCLERKKIYIYLFCNFSYVQQKQFVNIFVQNKFILFYENIINKKI